MGGKAGQIDHPGFRYVLTPKAQRLFKSHVAVTLTDSKRKTLCGLVMGRTSTQYKRYVWRRLLKAESIDLSTITCDHCIRILKGTSDWDADTLRNS